MKKIINFVAIVVLLISCGSEAPNDDVKINTVAKPIVVVTFDSLLSDTISDTSDCYFFTHPQVISAKIINYDPQIYTGNATFWLSYSPVVSGTLNSEGECFFKNDPFFRLPEGNSEMTISFELRDGYGRYIDEYTYDNKQRIYIFPHLITTKPNISFSSPTYNETINDTSVLISISINLAYGIFDPIDISDTNSIHLVIDDTLSVDLNHVMTQYDEMTYRINFTHHPITTGAHTIYLKVCPFIDNGNGKAYFLENETTRRFNTN